jgi:hypothetical protein
MKVFPAADAVPAVAEASGHAAKIAAYIADARCVLDDGRVVAPRLCVALSALYFPSFPVALHEGGYIEA